MTDLPDATQARIEELKAEFSAYDGWTRTNRAIDQAARIVAEGYGPVIDHQQATISKYWDDLTAERERNDALAREIVALREDLDSVHLTCSNYAAQLSASQRVVEAAKGWKRLHGPYPIMECFTPEDFACKTLWDAIEALAAGEKQGENDAG